jgi:restriction system protein
VTVWVIRAGKRGGYAEAFERAGIAGVALPNIPSVADMTPDQIREPAIQRLAAENPARASAYVSMLYRFAHEIEMGDLVVTPDGLLGELLLGRVVGTYEFDETPPVAGFNHLRRVAWLARRRREDVPPSVLPSLGAPMAVFAPGAQVALLALDAWQPHE